MTTQGEEETKKKLAVLKGEKAVNTVASLVFASLTVFAGYTSAEKFATAADFATNTEKRTAAHLTLTELCRNAMGGETADRAAVAKCADENTAQYMDGTADIEHTNGIGLAAGALLTLGIAGFYGRKTKTASDEISQLQLTINSPAA